MEIVTKVNAVLMNADVADRYIPEIVEDIKRQMD
jgi:hypothetical protein